MSLLILKRRKLVLPADWHGKLTNFPALRHHASAPPLGFDTGIGLEREHRGVLSGDADVVCALFYTEFPRAVPFGGQVRRGLR